MTPQHAGATATDLTTWDSADFDTSQIFAATNPAAAIPGAPVPPPDPQDLPDTHHIAA
ncbi:hypothetical protein ACH4TX_41740 [Streptomyces sp. NPDC021098]|uniref:hypothetical protein n=1 Tax=unclassified Streptomyces TaxID=2593676 RepID=UPI0037AD6A94